MRFFQSRVVWKKKQQDLAGHISPCFGNISNLSSSKLSHAYIYIYCIDIYQSLSTFVHFSEFWRCSSFFVVIIYLNGSTPPPKPYKSSDSSGYSKFHTFVNENLHREVGHLRVGWGQSWCFEPHTIPIRIPDGYGNGVGPAYHFGGSHVLVSPWKSHWYGVKVAWYLPSYCLVNRYPDRSWLILACCSHSV